MKAIRNRPRTNALKKYIHRGDWEICQSLIIITITAAAAAAAVMAINRNWNSHCPHVNMTLSRKSDTRKKKNSRPENNNNNKQLNRYGVIIICINYTYFFKNNNSIVFRLHRRCCDVSVKIPPSDNSWITHEGRRRTRTRLDFVAHKAFRMCTS